MKYSLLLLFLPLLSFSQEQTEKSSDHFYTQFDVSLPFRGNPQRHENTTDEQKSPWFLIDGIGTKFGVGVHFRQWIGIGVHGGIDGRISQKLVAVPIYANLHLAPKVGDDTRIVVETGYGFVTALGRGSLSGDYKRISIGFGTSDITVFAEYSQYGFSLNSPDKINAVSLGLSLFTF